MKLEALRALFRGKPLASRTPPPLHVFIGMDHASSEQDATTTVFRCSGCKLAWLSEKDAQKHKCGRQ